MSTITKINVNGVDYDIKDTNAQEKLVSGVNIKTINDQSILGEGNLDIAGGQNDYEKAINKPSINNIELIGNKKSSDLKLQDEMKKITNQDIDKLIFGG